MRSAFFGLHVAASGLHTARAAINVTAHNLANAELPGFTRQVAQMQAGRPLTVGSGRGMYGTGSRVTGIVQIRDRFLDRKYWHQSAIHGQFTATNTHLSFVETVFNQLPNVGVKRTFNNFFSTMHDLTTRAHEPTFRTNVATNAQSLAEQIRQNAFALQRQQQDLNREFSDVVTTINSLGSQITDVNRQIHIFERDGNNANDLRDQRALLIDQLSKLVNVQVEERDFSRPGMENNRRLSIMINGYDFIDHTRINRLELVTRNNPGNPRSGTTRNEMDISGLYDIFFLGTGSRFNIYSSTLSGKLRGIVDVRDGNGGQITATPILTGSLMVQTHLNALARTSTFLNGLSGQLTTLRGNLPAWVTLRDTSLYALGGATNTAQARDYVNHLIGIRSGSTALRAERTALEALLTPQRTAISSRVSVGSLRTMIAGAPASVDPYRTEINATLDSIETLLGTLSAIDSPSFLATFHTTLNGYLDTLAGFSALPADNLTAITNRKANVAGDIGNLEGTLERLEEIEDEIVNYIEANYGSVAALDARIAAAEYALNNLIEATTRISEFTTFSERMETQLEWAIRNAEDMMYLLRARIEELKTELRMGEAEAYQDFLDALEYEIGNMRAFAAGMILPSSLNVYSTLTDLDNFIDDLYYEIGGMGTGLPGTIDAILTTAAYHLPAGTSIVAGTTTNFKGIPFYMNQLNELVRTFARAMNEGRNRSGDAIPGAVAHVFGFDANGENRQALFFTFNNPITGKQGVLDAHDPSNSLRLWILQEHEVDSTGTPILDAAGNRIYTGNPRRDENGNFVTVQDPNPPADVALDSMGRPLFTIAYSQFNALNFAVNQELLSDPSLLAASSNQNIGQANNDVVHGFLAVGNDKNLFREGRLIDFIIATSNHLAVDNNQAAMFRQSFHEVTKQTHNHRLSVSSVDTEEEMLNLVRFNQMFIATSRLINVLDAVYDTLINRLGNF